MSRLSPERAAALHRIARQFGTPCYVYDAGRIRHRIDQLAAFDIVRFAQKANSNVHLLRLMRAQGVLVDAVSRGEIERALRAGYVVGGEPAEIVYTADLLDSHTLERVVELHLPVNAGSPDMLRQIGPRSPGHPVWLRVNPGFGHGHSRKTNTGGESSKHGIWYERLGEALDVIDAFRLELVGLHMHIGSGTDLEHLSQVANAMVDQVRMLGRDLQALSGGGGLPIPYTDDASELDVAAFFGLWDGARKEVEQTLGHAVRFEIEPGRFLVADAGVLVAEVRAVKMMGKNHFVLVDAGFDNLVRPAMYGSYHAMTVIDAEGRISEGPRQPTVVAGPLCESGDVFTQLEGGVVEPRELPEARVGDFIVFHDAGAYASSMASNYNSRPLAPEVLIDGAEVSCIRRRQTIAELLDLEEV